VKWGRAGWGAYSCVVLISSEVFVEGLDDGVVGVDLQHLPPLHVLGGARVSQRLYTILCSKPRSDETQDCDVASSELFSALFLAPQTRGGHHRRGPAG
jgi:hypothetical protein